jgi:TM2 domain-containing membrane protein YozV
MFCKQCGKEIADKAVICIGCGCSTSNTATEVKNPTLAAIFSGIIPGAGQYYCNNPKRGAMFFVGAIIGMFLFTIPGIIVWLANIADAYSLAKKINTGAVGMDKIDQFLEYNPTVKKISNMSKKKILIGAGIILFILMIASGVGLPRTIEVSGSPDMSYSGTYGSVESMTTVSGSIYDNKDIDIYDVPSSGIVTAVFQKKSSGELTVRIKRGGRVIREATTTARYGVVTVTD